MLPHLRNLPKGIASIIFAILVNIFSYTSNQRWQYKKFMLLPSISINGVLLDFHICGKYHNSSNMALPDCVTYKISCILTTTFKFYLSVITLLCYLLHMYNNNQI